MKFIDQLKNSLSDLWHSVAAVLPKLLVALIGIIIAVLVIKVLLRILKKILPKTRIPFLRYEQRQRTIKEKLYNSPLN